MLIPNLQTVYLSEFSFFCKIKGFKIDMLVLFPNLWAKIEFDFWPQKTPGLYPPKPKIWCWFRISSPFIYKHFRFSVKFTGSKLTCCRPSRISKQKSYFSNLIIDLRKIRDYILLGPKFDADSVYFLIHYIGFLLASKTVLKLIWLSWNFEVILGWYWANSP